jgi:glycosyltransferase involved in cell wall biosynthesis
MSDEATRISACLMVKNEEAVIRACLDSLQGVVDEIIVVDGQSTDRTVEICREFRARVEIRPFPGHVEQRTYSVSLASCPWVFCIDADERVTGELAREILSAVREAEDGVDGFSVPRLTVHLGRPVRHGGWYPDRKLRLARASRVRVAGTTPHDRLEVDGAVEKLGAPLLHLSYRDLSHHVQVIDRYTTVMARKRKECGRGPSLVRLVFSFPLKFLKMYVWKGGFLEGVRGFVVAVTGAFYAFLVQAKQWEEEVLQRDVEEKHRRGDSPFPGDRGPGR